MAQIYADSIDGYITKSSSTWSGARDATIGSSTSTTQHLNQYAVRASRTMSGGRGSVTYTYHLTRSFFRFDTSGINHVPVDGNIYIYGATFVAADVVLVRAKHGALWGTGEFDSIPGWATGTNNVSNVRTYSDVLTTWSNSGYNNFTLTGEALVDMVAYDSFQCCLIEYAYDLRNITPTSSANYSGVWFRDEEDASNKDPYLQYSPGTDHNQSLMTGANF